MSSKADIVIKSSTIFTGNTLEPVAGAVVIRGGRIIDVLSEHEADEHIGFETRIIDARDALCALDSMTLIRTFFRAAPL